MKEAGLPLEALLARFPKTRPPLPADYQALFAGHYKANREGRTLASALAQIAELWLHRRVAEDSRVDPSPKATLEIGAGTLNHLRHEPAARPYDIIEPFGELYRGSALLGRVRNIYQDMRDVPMRERYDRIISVACFEHICDLPFVIARAGLLLKDDGHLRVAIPSEGTLLWRWGWKLTTGLEFRLRYGLDYGVIMGHEHVNSAAEIAGLLQYFFSHLTRRVLGFNRQLSLYQFYSCQGPDRERCQAALDSFGKT